MYTFGFRGEALNLLCALAEVEVVTRTADAMVAHKLQYDAEGTLVWTGASTNSCRVRATVNV